MDRKRLLYIVAAEPHVSPFDVNLAYDAGFDAVQPYGGVKAGEVRGLVQDIMFSRGPKGARASALMIASADPAEAEAGFAAARKALFDPFRISLFIDPKGAYTTAAALVAKIEALRRAGGAAAGLDGATVLLLGGTGGVGRAAAGMAAAAGARVTLVSREAVRAVSAADEVKSLYGGTVAARGAAGEAERAALAAAADVVVATGAAGAALLSAAAAQALRGPKILADINAVPPAGLAGVDVRADGTALPNGVVTLGALAVGDLKNRVEMSLMREMLGDGPAPAIDAAASRARAAALLAGA